jgi:spore coat protein X
VEGYIFNPNGYGYLPITLNDNVDSISQSIVQKSSICQLSEEVIYIRDSENVTVTTTDLQVALNLQAVIQAIITLILVIILDDEERAARISQELFQKASIKQITRQRTTIIDSENVTVTTIDGQVALNLNLILHILLALIAVLDI